MTPQEFFDKTVNAIRAQGRPSIAIQEGAHAFGAACLYHGPNGLRCAAGVHITDAEYHDSLEGKTIRDLQLVLSPEHPLCQHVELAAWLQSAHDQAACEGEGFLAEFEVRIERIAKTMYFVYTAPGAA